MAVYLLRSGAWRDVRETPLGELLNAMGVDLDAAFNAIEDDAAVDQATSIDFRNISQWALSGSAESEGAPRRDSVKGRSESDWQED